MEFVERIIAKMRGRASARGGVGSPTSYAHVQLGRRPHSAALRRLASSKSNCEIISDEIVSNRNTEMSLVFFRKHPVGHVFDKAIQDWKSSADPKFGAMASNVTYDHRVSREREEELAKIAGSDPSGTELGNAFKKYFETKVRTRDLPHFVYEKLNEENILGLTPGGWKGPDRETLFVRVLDLSGLYYPMH